jgi:cytochrome c peroxidase
LVQLTFFQLHRSRADFRPDAKLRPWLLTIAFNSKRRHQRGRGQPLSLKVGAHRGYAAIRSNVKLTAPYFHNGGKRTLADVVDFYNRGGDFSNPELAKRIKPLSLDAGDQTALVDFLTNGLTDCRVEKERAPFDHPALAVPNGPTLPAVGQNGTGSCP